MVGDRIFLDDEVEKDSFVWSTFLRFLLPFSTVVVDWLSISVCTEKLYEPFLSKQPIFLRVQKNWPLKFFFSIIYVFFVKNTQNDLQLLHKKYFST